MSLDAALAEAGRVIAEARRALASTHDGVTVHQRIVDTLPGQPKAQRFDSERVGGMTSGDPTASAAMNASAGRHDFDQLHRDARKAREAAHRILITVASYTPRPAHELERRREQATADPGCSSCARVEVAPGVPQWARVRATTTVGGLLDEPADLCAWCERHVKQTGVIPSDSEIVDHYDGSVDRVRCHHVRIDGKAVAS